MPSQILPFDALLRTGQFDHADWNYRPLLGSIQRARFSMVGSLIGTSHFGRLLEIGYGSGVFMPDLATRCDQLYGIDIHKRPHAVSEVLARHHVSASLVAARAEAMPFEAGGLDCVVAVSVLEFVQDLDAVCLEIKRVLRPEGRFITVLPGSSPVLDWGLKVLTGEDARRDFGNRRERVVPTLRRHFRVRREIEFPSVLSSAVKLYQGFILGVPCERTAVVRSRSGVTAAT